MCHGKQARAQELQFIGLPVVCGCAYIHVCVCFKRMRWEGGGGGSDGEDKGREGGRKRGIKSSVRKGRVRGSEHHRMHPSVIVTLVWCVACMPQGFVAFLA